MVNMELPDKIYVTTCSINSWYGYKFGCWTERECPGNAYISKDALLEWAKKKNERIDTDEGDYSLGYVSAMIDLIDKIESL